MSLIFLHETQKVTSYLPLTEQLSSLSPQCPVKYLAEWVICQCLMTHSKGGYKLYGKLQRHQKCPSGLALSGKDSKREEALIKMQINA